MATYGEGDPTDNAQDFYDWLQENDDEDLSGLNYTVSLRPRSVSEDVCHIFLSGSLNLPKCFVSSVGLYVLALRIYSL